MARKNVSGYERVALVLQGGGALGAYQAGVFEALQEHGYTPDWIAGTSIGAINAALIAGNAPAQRVPRLQEFWRTVASIDPFTVQTQSVAWRRFNGFCSAMRAVVAGQAGFFRPRLNPFGSHGTETAGFYDTAPLKRTLTQLIDFDRLNDGGVRLSVGAVNVTRGDVVYFDTLHANLGVEHIMASGALPPGFAAVRVDGDLYWDGGLYSNTPLEIVLEDSPRVNTLAFTINLWNREGIEPATMLDVFAREKEIRYASRFENHVATYRKLHNMRRAIRALYRELPEDKRDLPEFKELADQGCHTTMNIVRLGRASHDWELSSKDVDFSWSTVRERWQRGYDDAQRMLVDEPWKAGARRHTGVIIHDLPVAEPEPA